MRASISSTDPGRAPENRSSWCFWSTVSQYLNSRMPSSVSIFSNTGACFRNARIGRRAEPHDFLDPGAVVTAAIEHQEFACGWEVRDVALKYHCVRSRSLGFDSADVDLAGVEAFGDRADHAALAGGASAFDQHDHAFAAVFQPAGQVVQLDLHRLEQDFVPIFLFEFVHGG